MSNIIASPISAGMFHFDSENNVFSQEASSLQKEFSAMGQIWDDSCDQGFKMVSVKNPDYFVLYVFTQCDYHDGEMVGWNFVAVDDRNTQRMGMVGTQVLIIND